jgi:hypothetical protein
MDGTRVVVARVHRFLRGAARAQDGGAQRADDVDRHDGHDHGRRVSR